MVKFQKISAATPRRTEESTSAGSESDAPPPTKRRSSGKAQAQSPVESHILDFLADRFVANFEVKDAELQPQDIDFDAEEEEVYFLQVPKAYDVQRLIGKKVNLEKKTKIGAEEISGKVFEIIRKGGEVLPKTVITQRTHDGQLVLTTLEPKGALVLRESTKDLDEDDGLEEFLNEFDERENGVVLLPTNLKQRHPLLGADFEAELSSRSRALAAQRIKQEESTPIKKKAKKRKAVEEDPTETPTPSSEEPPKRRKKKGLETSADLQWLENI